MSPTSDDRMNQKQHWQQIYDQVPLCEIPLHFAGISRSPFLLEYLKQVLSCCPAGGRTLETGVGSGYGAVWLSLRGISAEGIDYSPLLVERAQRVNDILQGNARFASGDLFDLYESYSPDSSDTSDNAFSPRSSGGKPFSVIHHQGVLEHFTVPQIRAALAQQIALADWVVFSVPSVHYPFDPEFGDERLLPLEEWRHILAPFGVEVLRYYGDPQLGEREHLLCVLRGAITVNDALQTLMFPGPDPYLPGVSAVVQTRNEGRHIADCLRSLQGWADEVIVCDMESEDDTIAIAEAMGAQIIRHPHISNFDRARNVSAMRARHRWVFFLDADERVPERLGAAIRSIAGSPGGSEPMNQPDSFEAMLIPFRHHFVGQWMRCLYPGYTAARLLRNGLFIWGARPHSGVKVDGRTVLFPAEDPNLALVHHSFESLSHYLEKLNRYTDSESANMYRDGLNFHWTEAVRHFAEDFLAYEQMGAFEKDGIHGFLYAFLSGFYRFEQWAKLYEHRFRAGQLQQPETNTPSGVEEVLEYALKVVRAKKQTKALVPTPAPIRIVDGSVRDAFKKAEEGAAQVVWSGPLRDPSGYGEECRNFLFALDDTNVPVAAHEVPWSQDVVEQSDEEERRFARMSATEAIPGFIHIVQNFAPSFFRHPQAGVAIGRTMFETDRLPPDWVTGCNRMDRVWVPSEFNRQTFQAAGVAPEKLMVIPGCLDPEPYRILSELRTRRPCEDSAAPFTFLSVFDWTLHKGWDVLLRAFLEAFEGREDVRLILKVWSTMGYDHKGIEAQAANLLRREYGLDLASYPQILFVTERFARTQLLRFYVDADAFVLPSRGEGWGRPYMEAMALGLPTIGTGWSGNTAFMNEENSYIIRSTLVPVSERGWNEVPTYRGHRWAEPDREHLKEILTHAVTHKRGESKERALLGQAEVLERFSRKAVGAQIATEIARMREEMLSTPVLVSTPTIATTTTQDSTPVPPAPDLPATASTDDTPAVDNLREEVANTDFRPFTTSKMVHSIIRVRWEGTQFRWHSLAHVNRSLCSRLVDTPGIEMSLVPFEQDEIAPEVLGTRGDKLAGRVFASPSGPVQVHVRHHFPPRLKRPQEGYFVLVQPWEYGFLPDEWVPAIRNQVDEVWCYSNYVRNVYLSSGVASEKLFVLPLGVDVSIFRPEAPPYVFTTETGAEKGLYSGGTGLNDEATFTFLFVGGTLHRKGIDILLEAYSRAFTSYDNVLLIIKDTGTETVYRDQNAREKILELAGDATRPRIIYLQEELSEQRLAGVYTAANCLVQPYRGEGFCLPALEAMACGVPALVPEGGPTDDFVDETVGWRIAAGKKPFGDGIIGNYVCTGPTWMFEVSVDDLARQMRRIAADPEEARRRGGMALDRVRSSWTWDHAANRIAVRLREIAESTGITDIITANPDTIKRPQENLPLQIEQSPITDTSNEAAVKSRINPTVSLCMIVRNEERVLDACLTSANPWFDEIVVVDTGSTDRTVEIAEHHGAKIIHFPWCDDFSAARNISLSQATGDWVMWMDADDTLPEQCGKKIQNLVLLAEEKTMGFLMQVHIPAAPGEQGFTIVDHVKLFRNRPDVRFQGRIHEQILESISRAGGMVERSDLYVVHSGYDYSEEGQLKKRQRDLTILEKDLAERPEHPFVWFNIGMTAFHLKDFDRAVPALQKCLSLANPRESIVRKVYAMLSGSFQERQDLRGAQDWVEKGLRIFPRDPELLFRAGNVYREVGDLPAAERSYQRLLTEREVGHLDSLDVTMVGFKAYHNLALIYRDMHRWDDAEKCYRTALKLQPGFLPSENGLEELHRLKQKQHS